ncbi:MAG: thrombospondin type 3 repeat-containing protein, partial [bacterium]|nr:thrombospondin type 3 repeat-containing protein [bacterium]
MIGQPLSMGRGLALGLLFCLASTAARAQTRSWTFDTDGDTGGWGTAKHSIAGVEAVGGALHFQITGNDPYIFSPVLSGVSADRYKFIKLVMKATFGNTNGSIYWATVQDPVFNENRTIGFKLGPPDAWQTYYIELDESKTWAGDLTRFRIDPGNGPAGEVWIDEVSIIDYMELPPRADIVSFSYPDSLYMTADAPTTLTALVRNGKGPVARFDLNLALPAGVELTSGTASLALTGMAPGEERTIQWGIRAAQPLTAEAGLTVAVGGTALAARATPIYVVSSVLPPPAGAADGLQLADQGDAIVLNNSRVRLVIQRETFGGGRFGPLHLEYYDGGAWRRIATCPVFGTMIYDGTTTASSFLALEPTAWQTNEQTADRIRLTLSADKTDGEGRTFAYACRISLEREASEADFSVSLSADQPFGLRRLDGPFFHCGADPAVARDEAILPGLEWLEKHESSSSSIVDYTDNHLRYVPHPYKVTQPYMAMKFGDVLVAGLWNIGQPWDAAGDTMPLAFFTTPDTYYGRPYDHIMGLFLPGYGPGFVENARETGQPHAVAAGETLNLDWAMWVRTGAASAVEATDYYIARDGLPDPMPYPHGSLQDELKFTMEAYMDSQWDPVNNEWVWLHGDGRPPNFIASLWRASQLVDNPALADQYRQRALLVYNEPGTSHGGTMLPFLAGGMPANLVGMRGQAETLLSQRDSEGLWVYDNDTTHSSLTNNRDWTIIGGDNASEMGSSTANALTIMQYALLSGDRDIVTAMEPTLEAMKRFKVPRGAQIWEVPLLAPETLAASDGLEIYTIAYRLTGRRDYLDQAVYWAKADLNFFYTWGLPQYDFMLYDTIPVYGATWFTGSWFGRPVQWLGLDLGEALLKLAKVDQSHDWRKIAQGLLVSGIRQQRNEPGDRGLYPDSWNLMANTYSATALLTPSRIDTMIFDFMGYPTPQTTIVDTGQGAANITTFGEVTGAAVAPSGAGYRLSFDLRHAPRQRIFTLICGPARPAAVTRNGAALPEVTTSVYNCPEGYSFRDPGSIEIATDFADGDTVHYEIDFPSLSAHRVQITSTPTVLPTLFDRDTDFEGWTMAHHLADYAVQDGGLNFRTSGVDPYLTVPTWLLPGQFTHILFRMSLDLAGGGQFFWATSAEPQMNEAKSVRFTPTADGAYHDYQLDLGANALWAGQTVTALRIDPASEDGTHGRIDWVTAGTPLDTDGDAMPDAWEAARGLDPLSPEDGAFDPDADGLANAAEYFNRTDPHAVDTDMDGYGDQDELAAGSDPTDRASRPVVIHNPVWSFDFVGGQSWGWIPADTPPTGMTLAPAQATPAGLEPRASGVCSGGA